MPTYTEEDIQLLENHIVNTYMADLGPSAAAELFRDVRRTLEADEGLGEISQQDIESLAESYR